jgi:hypothetical protein
MAGGAPLTLSAMSSRGRTDPACWASTLNTRTRRSTGSLAMQPGEGRGSCREGPQFAWGWGLQAAAANNGAQSVSLKVLHKI